MSNQKNPKLVFFLMTLIPLPNAVFTANAQRVVYEALSEG